MSVERQRKKVSLKEERKGGRQKGKGREEIGRKRNVIKNMDGQMEGVTEVNGWGKGVVFKAEELRQM